MFTLRVELPAALTRAFMPAADGDEPVSLPLGAAFIIGILWLYSDKLLRKRLAVQLGSVLDEDGVPRYRCATGFSAQLVFLPALFLLSLASNDFSINQWMQTAGAAFFTESGLRFYDWAFCYVFAGYMLADVVLLKELSFLLKLHHVGCLLGLAIGFVGLPSGFPLFAAGVLSFELGSAAMNLWCLYPQRQDYFNVYVVAMSASNFAAALCCAAWVLRVPAGVGARLVAMALTAVFVCIRQKTVVDAMAKRAAEAAIQRGNSPKATKRLEALDARSESPKSPMGLNFSLRKSTRRLSAE